jgi:heptosyltransferase-2
VIKATDCLRFTGYKPCEPGRKCEGCADREPVMHTTLLINLDNLGNVIQMTSLLPAIARAFPGTAVTWVTAPSAAPVLEGAPVSRVMSYDAETVSVLGAMEFDLVLNVDKTQRSAALAMTVRAKEKRGFGLSARGAIEPLNPEAEYSYRLGLDDELKFRGNSKPGTQIAAEAFGLEWRRDPYAIGLSTRELERSGEYRAKLGADTVVGMNTGSSPGFANKSMSVDRHVELIGRLAEALPDARFALLGGPHETEKNAEIAKRSSAQVFKTPTTEGVRSGLVHLNACDVVVSGDTSGLHMGVGLGKWVVSYFGVTCAQEIDLYDFGVKVVSAEPCSPCWRPTCPDPKCIRGVDLDAIVEGVVQGVKGVRQRL